MDFLAPAFYILSPQLSEFFAMPQLIAKRHLVCLFPNFSQFLPLPRTDTTWYNHRQKKNNCRQLASE